MAEFTDSTQKQTGTGWIPGRLTISASAKAINPCVLLAVPQGGKSGWQFKRRM